MKPTKVQYFCAQQWPTYAWLISFSLCGAGLAVYASDLASLILSQPAVSFWLACLVVLGAAIGWLCGGIAGAFILGPFYVAVGKLNGAPFQPGDQVQILAGPHRDHVFRVYEVWEVRNQVRVDLGEKAVANFSDVFSSNEICRVSKG